MPPRNVNTVNAIGYRFGLFSVANGSRTKVDGQTIGFPATPSANKQETVLSPAAGEVDATVVTLTVRSVVFIRSTGLLKVKVINADNTFYEQIVDAVFSMSPSQPVTIELQTGETHNVSATIIWS